MTDYIATKRPAFCTLLEDCVVKVPYLSEQVLRADLEALLLRQETMASLMLTKWDNETYGGRPCVVFGQHYDLLGIGLEGTHTLIITLRDFTTAEIAAHFALRRAMTPDQWRERAMTELTRLGVLTG